MEPHVVVLHARVHTVCSSNSSTPTYMLVFTNCKPRCWRKLVAAALWTGCNSCWDGLGTLKKNAWPASQASTGTCGCALP
eukprot:4037792-Pleurochrysis_carterae.AAC.1